MITVKSTGADAMRSAIRTTLPGAIARETAPGVVETADAAVAQARANVRVRSGRLRAALAARVLHRDAGGTVAAIGVTDPVAASYFLHVELGTHRTPAHPSVGPAIDAQRGAFMNRMGDAGRRVERLNGGGA